VISFSQAAGFYPLIFPKGFLLILERIDSLERKKNIFILNHIFLYFVFISLTRYMFVLFIFIFVLSILKQ
jgi:hypothetical protein